MADAAPAPPTQQTPDRRPRGRPTRLTPEVEAAIFAAVRSHQRVEVAWELAGIKKETFYGWLRAAARARLHVERGGKLSDLSTLTRRCLDFSDSLTREMAMAEAFAVRDVVHAGSQPYVETRRTTRCAGLDKDSRPIMVEEVTRTERPPDWRARMAWLQARVPAYNPKQRHEHSGPDGGPVPIAIAVRLEGLAAAIAEHQAIEATSHEIDPEADL